MIRTHYRILPFCAAAGLSIFASGCNMTAQEAHAIGSFLQAVAEIDSDDAPSTSIYIDGPSSQPAPTIYNHQAAVRPTVHAPAPNYAARYYGLGNINGGGQASRGIECDRNAPADRPKECFTKQPGD